MTYRGTIIILLILSVLGLGFGVLAEPGSFGLSCLEDGIFCWNPFVSVAGEPFLWTSLVLSIVSIILLFVRREVFISWAKFAAFGFPIMLGILFYTHQTPNAGGFGLGGLISDEMLATAVLPPLFFIISLSIIIWRSWKLRRSR